MAKIEPNEMAGLNVVTKDALCPLITGPVAIDGPVGAAVHKRVAGDSDRSLPRRHRENLEHRNKANSLALSYHLRDEVINLVSLAEQ